MKYTLALSVLFWFSNIGCGQGYTIEWSEMDRIHGRLVYLLPKDSNEFYALRWSGSRLLGSYQVSRHKDLKLAGTGRIKLQAEESIATFEGARVIGDHFVVFLSDKRDGQNHFYMQNYSEELKPIDEPIKLASYDLERFRTRGWFDIIHSSNKNYFAVVWEIPGKKGERDIYGFKIYDLNMNLINEGEYPLPFDASLSKIHSHHISNSGDYFLALTEYKESPEKKLFRSPLDFKALHIYHIAEDGLQDFTLDVDGRRIQAMAMTSDDQNIFTITGIYGNINENGVSGVFYQRLNLADGKILNEGFEDFSESFITQDWSDRALKKAERREERGKGEPQLYDYKMREVTILDDGSVVGTMEQYYVQVRSYTDSRSGQMSNTYYYYYNDIIAYKINPEGEFAWIEKIKKFQVSSNDGGPYSSYESFVDEGKVYFIFNDNVRNYSEDGKFIESDGVHTANYGRRKNVVGLAEINLETGEQKRRTFFDRSEIDALAVPKLFNVSYNTGEMLLYSLWGRKEKIGVLRFND